MYEYGIYYWFGYPVYKKERLRLIKKAGFDNIMLWWDDNNANFDGDKKELVEMAQRLDLYVENIHAPYEKSSYIWLDSGVKSSMVIEQYKKCISDCADCNIPTLVIHLTNGKCPPSLSQKGLDRFKYLVEYAEKKEVNIALENLRRPDYLDFIFSNISSTRLGFCYDSGHENCYSSDVDLLERYGNMLMALHLHDNNGVEDQHKIPGEGTINWSFIVAKLKSLNYCGSVSLEVMNEFPEPSLDIRPDEYLALAYQRLRSYFS